MNLYMNFQIETWSDFRFDIRGDLFALSIQCDRIFFGLKDLIHDCIYISLQIDNGVEKKC